MHVAPPKAPSRHKVLWLAFLFVGLLASVAIINTAYDKSLTGNAIAINNVGYAKGGTSLTYAVRDIVGLSQMVLYFSENVKGASVIVEQTGKDMKSGVYTRFVVSSLQRSSISKIDLTLKIKESDLKKLGMNPAELRIDNNGKILVPELIRIDRGYVSYKVTSTRLGTFSIVKK